MDPITTAIIAALANLSKDAIKDGYNALKATLKKKFGSDSDLVDAVAGLEKKPESEARKAMLQEEVDLAKVNDDPDIIQLAQDLLNKIQEQPGGGQVINQTQNNEISGVINVGRDFKNEPKTIGTQTTISN